MQQHSPHSSLEQWAVGVALCCLLFVTGAWLPAQAVVRRYRLHETIKRDWRRWPPPVCQTDTTHAYILLHA